MNIRRATKYDIESVLMLLKDFHEESIDKYNIFCNDKIARSMMLRYVDNSLILEDQGAIVGIIAGIVTTYPLNDEKLYQEAIWYVKEEYRAHGVDLLRALEEWCKERDIKKIVMIHMSNSMPDKLKMFYESVGYAPLESHYLKQL